jgi:hydrogenase nickel incorporation protein HypA/HybF
MGQLALFVIIQEWNMRELQIIRSIVDQVLRSVQENGQKRATRVHMALGELSDLDPVSIQTQWRELSQGTCAEQAHLYIRLIPAEVQCMACFQNYRPSDKTITCPVCGSFGAKILTGEECYLESIETEHA